MKNRVYYNMLPAHVQRQFAENIEKHGKLSLKEYLNRRNGKNNQSQADFIDLAFTWDSTPEGHSYWDRINDMFVHEIGGDPHEWEGIYEDFPEHSKRNEVINNYQIY